MPVDSREKGTKYEVKTKNWYQKLFPRRKVKRSIQAEAGDNDPDVIVEGLTLFGKEVWIECGCRKPGCWVIDKWKQAREASRRRKAEPVVHCRWNKGEELVVISRELFGRLLKKGQKTYRWDMDKAYSDWMEYR